MKKRLVIGLSGASGAPLGIELLRGMQYFPDWETHLVYSSSFVKTLAYESSLSLEDVCHLADQVYPLDDVAASVSSGTFRTEGMVIIPCSMKTLAADVTLKERRKLVLVTRETPLSQIHLRNMLSLTQTGAVILPPMLTYYNNPQTIEDMTRHIVGKVMAEFGLEHPKFHRWK